MIVRNISGAEKTLGFGRRTHVLADNATVEIEEDTRTQSYVADHMAKGHLEIVSGSKQMDHGDAATSPGHILVEQNTTGSVGDWISIAAPNMVTQTLELESGGGVTQGNISVTIGSDAADTLANIKTSINGSTVLGDAGIVADEVVDSGAVTLGWLLVKTVGRVNIDDVTVVSTPGDEFIGTVVAANANESLASQHIYVSAVGATTYLMVTALENIVSFDATYLTAAGAVLAYDGTVTASGGALYFGDDGSTDLAADSQILINVHGR